MNQKTPLLSTCALVLVFFALAAAPLAAEETRQNAVVSVIPGVRLGPLGETTVYTLGIGGRASFALPLEYVPLLGRLGVGFYRYGASDDVVDFGSSLMLIPELGVDYVIPFALGSLDARVWIGASYRHYINWHQFISQTYLSARPMASAVVGADVTFGAFGAGLSVAYDMVFESRIRHVIEPGLLLTMTL
ncbi:MAG: hypothetical protein ACLFP4_06940 [Spirochaetales bacterium]